MLRRLSWIFVVILGLTESARGASSAMEDVRRAWLRLPEVSKEFVAPTKVYIQEILARPIRVALPGYRAAVVVEYQSSVAIRFSVMNAQNILVHQELLFLRASRPDAPHAEWTYYGQVAKVTIDDRGAIRIEGNPDRGLYAGVLADLMGLEPQTLQFWEKLRPATNGQAEQRRSELQSTAQRIKSESYVVVKDVPAPTYSFAPDEQRILLSHELNARHTWQILSRVPPVFRRIALAVLPTFVSAKERPEGVTAADVNCAYWIARENFTKTLDMFRIDFPAKISAAPFAE